MGSTRQKQNSKVVDRKLMPNIPVGFQQIKNAKGVCFCYTYFQVNSVLFNTGWNTEYKKKIEKVTITSGNVKNSLRSLDILVIVGNP